MVSGPVAPAARTRLNALGEKAGRSPAGVGVAPSQAGMEHVSSASGHRQEGVVAPYLGVGEPGPALVLEARRSGQMVESRSIVRGASPGPAPALAGSGRQLARDQIDLADMAPGERAQERAKRGGSQHRMAKHGLGGPSPQSIGALDRVTPGEHRVHQGHGLVAYVGPPRGVAQIDVGVEQGSKTEVLSQGGRLNQARVGHRVVVVEDHLHPIQAVR